MSIFELKELIDNSDFANLRHRLTKGWITKEEFNASWDNLLESLSLEKKYEEILLNTILDFAEKKISKENFIDLLQFLSSVIGRVYAFTDFKDKELGQSKYWIEEMSYYGVDEVLEQRFNFVEFYKRRKSGKPYLLFKVDGINTSITFAE